MKKNTLIVVLLVVLVLFSVQYVAFGQDSTGSAGRIGAAHIHYTAANRTYPGAASLESFIETGSLSRNCLVTLGNTTYAWEQPEVFCAPQTNGDGKQGITVTILYHRWLGIGVPDDLYVSFTVYQEFAKGYGEPVPYTPGP